MIYFSDYEDALTLADGEESKSKPEDRGGEVLPFNHLDDRRFEVLVYKLKCIEHGSSNRVYLMQGVGDRGRDVVVYTPHGQVLQVIQCKNLRKPMSAQQLRRELLKLALYAFLEPSILGQGPATYELWCTSGLSGPASPIVAQWPTLWTEPALAEPAIEVIGEYKAFSSITWESVKGFVVHDFPRIVRVTREDPVDMASRVRRNVAIYQQYFQANIVVPAEPLADRIMSGMKDMLREVLAGGDLVPLKDQDARRMVERLAAFPPEKRMVSMSGNVMGLSPELVSKFNQGEYRSFVDAAIQATFGIIHTVQDVCARLAKEAAMEFNVTVRPRNQSLTNLLLKLLTMSALSKLNGLTYKGLKLQSGLEAYAELTLEQRLEVHVVELWDENQACIAGYDPTKHPIGSAEELRHRIGQHLLGDFKGRQAFEEYVRACLRKHIREIETIFRKFMSLLPDDLLVITDTVTIFDNERLFQRSIEETQLLSKLRGSSIIPE